VSRRRRRDLSPPSVPSTVRAACSGRLPGCDSRGPARTARGTARRPRSNSLARVGVARADVKRAPCSSRAGCGRRAETPG